MIVLCEQFSSGIESDELLADVVGYLEACRDRYGCMYGRKDGYSRKLFYLCICIYICMQILHILRNCMYVMYVCMCGMFSNVTSSDCMC